MKLLENYLKSKGFEVFGVRPNKRLMAFKYSNENKPQFSIKVTKKSGLYSMNFTDYRYDSAGELEFMITPYMRDILDFLKGYNSMRFKKLCEERKKTVFS